MICRKLGTWVIQKHQNEASFHILCMKYLKVKNFLSLLDISVAYCKFEKRDKTTFNIIKTEFSVCSL
jgi:hypothetical protein